jgi:hypothetical protein
MLQEMGDARLLLGFPPRPGVNPEANGGGTDVRNRLCNHSNAVGENVTLIHKTPEEVKGEGVKRK